jgi:hypothetical protein
MADISISIFNKLQIQLMPEDLDPLLGKALGASFGLVVHLLEQSLLSGRSA